MKTAILILLPALVGGCHQTKQPTATPDQRTSPAVASAPGTQDDPPWRNYVAVSNESPAQLFQRLDNECRSNMFHECSNWIGFQRIIDADHTYILHSNREVLETWSAAIDIDYINKVGGIERTNLIFRFEDIGNGGAAFINEAAMFDRRLAAIH